MGIKEILKEHVMQPTSIIFAMALCLLTAHSYAQAAQFFRIAGPASTHILAVNTDGTVLWTNAQPGATFKFQSATSFNGVSNWVDYANATGTAGVNSNRLFDPKPPGGMAFIPAGSFTMGNCMDTNEGVAAELPLHTVYVSPFYMDKYVVTKALWDSVYHWATNNGYGFDHPGLGKATNQPVQSITWYDSVKWCNARSEMENRTPCYYTTYTQTNVYRTGTVFNLTNACVNWSANGYRLPTEAEWEKAARGGLSDHRFPWGDTISWNNANFFGSPPTKYTYQVNTGSGYDPAYTNDVTPFTSPVDAFPPNGYGLYDMGGNVIQMCWDGLDNNWYTNSGAIQNDTHGPEIPLSNRVVRGGNWRDSAYSSRCSYRYTFAVVFLNNTGFRCVRVK